MASTLTPSPRAKFVTALMFSGRLAFKYCQTMDCRPMSKRIPNSS